MYYIFWLCVFSLSYPACKAHALYCHLWPVWLCHIFFYVISWTARFSEKVMEHKMCFDFRCIFIMKHFSFYEEFGAILASMYIALHAMYPLFLSHFKENLIFSRDFRKIIEYLISWKSAQLEQSFSKRTDGHADMTKLIFVFRNYAKVLKKRF